MNQKDLKSKRAAIRREIKQRMQDELDARKKEIRRKIKREDISVEEKREKYRREVHAEKLRLIAMAKEEYRARKRMLGPVEVEEEYEEYQDVPAVEEDLDVAEVAEDAEEVVEEGPEEEIGIAPEEAFIMEDDDETDQELLRDFQSPIGEADALVPDLAMPGDVPAEEEAGVSESLFYYIISLIAHPVQALDAFDDYLAAPSGLVKVILLYLFSFLPAVVFFYVGESLGGNMPSGLISNMVESSLSQQEPYMIVINGILGLLSYSACVALVNYFVTSEANFLTLTIYFAFVEAVTSFIVYTLVIAAVFAAIIAPPLLILVALLMFALMLWRIALNVVVLMSAYGYGLFGGLCLAIGAGILRNIIVTMIFMKYGAAFLQ